MLSKIIIGLFLSFLVTISHARPNPDELGICYLFKGDNLQDKGACIVSTGYGAGGVYTSLYFNKKDYLFEFTDYEEADKLSYLRDSGFYHKITRQLLEDYDYGDNDYLMCYKSRPSDVCYRVPQPIKDN